MRDNIESNHLIFISSDGKREGYEIFKERIKNNMWPIYNKTPQLINIKKDKKVLFYIAGTNNFAQNFIANALIDEVVDLKETTIDPNQEFKQVLFNVKFKDFKYFQKPINIREHIDNLSFIDEKKRNIYGLYFQGGVCKINQQSYDYIIKNTLAN